MSHIEQSRYPAVLATSGQQGMRLNHPLLKKFFTCLCVGLSPPQGGVTLCDKARQTTYVTHLQMFCADFGSNTLSSLTGLVTSLGLSKSTVGNSTRGRKHSC